MRNLSIGTVFQLTRDTVKAVGNDEITLEAVTRMRVVEVRNGQCCAVRHHSNDPTVNTSRPSGEPSRRHWLQTDLAPAGSDECRVSRGTGETDQGMGAGRAKG